MPYFDLRPKRNRKDLFNMEEEIKEFTSIIKRKVPLALILGLKRYGKTSLVLTCLEELKIPYIYIDCRLLPSLGALSINDFTSILIESIPTLARKTRERIYRYLEKIEGITIAGIKLRIRPSKIKFQTLLSILEKINSIDERIVIVIDEAQELRRITRYRIDSLFAYIYDHLENITLILTGSQIGLLYKLLRKGNPEAPLYGRAYSEIKLKPFTPKLSIKFLQKGFNEQGLNPPQWFLEKTVEKLDGIVGWLTYLGFKVCEKRRFDEKIIEEILKEAMAMSIMELEHFLSNRYQARKRYLAILKTAAILENASWNELYRAAEAKVGRIPKPTYNKIIGNLVDAGFLTKKEKIYSIPDPVLKEALKSELIKI
ncbi:MAG: ATP-binding protein [archaeon GB-1867-035]|nr:ATP-binding protein [Candidatus Culexmicrobium profundum]